MGVSINEASVEHSRSDEKLPEKVSRCFLLALLLPYLDDMHGTHARVNPTNHHPSCSLV